MSDITPSTPFHLEALPDEILLEIFQYIKPIDLFSFKGHNQRLNNVIRDVKLNIVIEYPEGDDEKDLGYLMNFPPEQFIRIELGYGWRASDLNIFQQLRSLTLNCIYLSKCQLDLVHSIKLHHLERMSVYKVPHFYRKELLLLILNNEHFPSLETCQLTGDVYSFIETNDYCQLPNNTMRVLILNQWYGSQLGPLFDLLPNLQRFEANIDECIYWLSNIDKPHMSLSDVRVTLDDSLNDLNGMLQFMPNLRRLHVRGKINENSVIEHFKKLAKIIRSHTSALQRFDCELYFHSWHQTDSTIIQQFDPLFKQIQCLLGENGNHCYATNLTEYPPFSEYTYVERSVNHATSYSGAMHGYDSDQDYHCDYHHNDND